VDASALPALLLAAGFVALARVLLARAAPDGSARPILLTLAVGVAVPAGLWVAGTRPALPLRASEDAWLWLVWLVPAAAVLGVLETLRALRFVRWVISPIGCGATAWLLLSPLPDGESPWSTLSLLGLWEVANWPTAPERRRLLSASLAAALLATPAILVRGAHSFALAAFAAVLGAALLAAVLSPRRGVAPLPVALAGVVGVGLGGVLLAAHAYARIGGADGFPAAPALWLGGAAVCGVLVPLRIGRAAPIVAFGLGLGLAAVAAWTSGAFRPYERWW
jgi:hypothetical protein